MITNNNVELSFVYLARLEVSIINYIVKSVEADITMKKKSMTKCYTPRLKETPRFKMYGEGFENEDAAHKGQNWAVGHMI